MSPSQRTSRQQHATHYLRHAQPCAKSCIGETLQVALPTMTLETVQHPVKVTYLDTFDWRLLRAGQVLVHERRGADCNLVLRGLDQPVRRLSRTTARPPADASQVEGAFLRRRVAGLTDGRALLPVAAFSRRETLYLLRDEDGKQRVRAAWREDRLRRGGARCHLLLEPLTGYAAEARGARAALFEAGWTPADDPLYVAARACGHEPLGYPLPPHVPLEPGMPALAAVQATGLRLLELMQLNLPGVRESLDSEFLHDFRVALRRTRTLLGEVRGVLPEAVLRRFGREFRWLGGLSGPVRDGDVQTEAMAAVAAALPAQDRTAMAPFQAWLTEQRERVRGDLLQALDSARYLRLSSDWGKRLSRPVPARSRLPDATRPVGEVAEACIRRAFKRVLRDGRRIDDSSPPVQLHDLRKEAKKLRYLIETFRPLYTQRAVDTLVKDLKSLQDNLGEFQDVEVQRHLMACYVPRAPQHTAALLTRLGESLAEREARVRAGFAGRFAAFSSRGVRRHLDGMLADGAK